MDMKKFTKELGPGWITLVENDDYALSRLIFGDGLEVDCDEEETPLLKKGFQQIQEYWTGHRVIFTLPLVNLKKMIEFLRFPVIFLLQDMGQG